jgi:hypothetical protein
MGWMRDRSGRQAVRAWLVLAVAAAAIAIATKLWLGSNHPAPPAPPSTLEPGWGWNDNARLDVCLSLRSAPETSASDQANLLIDGTLLGSGALPSGGRTAT